MQSHNLGMFFFSDDFLVSCHLARKTQAGNMGRERGITGNKGPKLECNWGRCIYMVCFLSIQDDPFGLVLKRNV